MTPMVTAVVPPGSLDAITKSVPGDVGVFIVTLVVVWYVIKDIIAVVRKNSLSDKDKSDKELHRDILKLLRDNSTTLAVIRSEVESLRSKR
jgi:hypothetical protein